MYFYFFLQQLKSLRHPYILHYVGFEETGSGPCLITEKVVPLEILLPKMSSTEICAGLQNVLEGLEFLHDRVGQKTLMPFFTLLQVTEF